MRVYSSDAGEVTVVVGVPGPMPTEPIDRIRELLANPPRLDGVHLRRARDLSAYEAARLLALVDAITEAARER